MPNYLGGRNIFLEAMGVIGESKILIYRQSGQNVSDYGILENTYAPPITSKAVIHSVPWREISLYNLDQNQEWIYVYTSEVIRCADAEDIGSASDYILYNNKKYRAKTYAENWYNQGGWSKILMYKDDRL
jgi:hypothetical protein